METLGISAQTTEDANVGNDRTTHDANTVAEAHSALQAENQKLFEYAQSLQQHLDQLLAASREKDDSMIALQHRVDAMNAKDAQDPGRAPNASRRDSQAGGKQRCTSAETFGGGRVESARHVHRKPRADSIQAAGYRAHQAVFARRVQEQRLDERTHICAVRELTKLMYEMRGEWAQLKGKMANPAEMRACQGRYETSRKP